jgi:SpoVK/Ycf46/Vps4 family AAA+-type ATPase
MADILPSFDASDIKTLRENADMFFKEQKYKEALATYEFVSDNCDGWELSRMADIYSGLYKTPKDLVKAHIYYLKAAEKGSVYAKTNVATDILNGFGTEKDIPVGLEMLTKVAKEEDYVWAQQKLGYLYYGGFETIAKDYTQSLQWFLLGAKKNNATCLYNLGLQYQYGYGVEKNMRTACDFYTRALRYGSPQAPKKLQDIQKELWPEFTLDLINGSEDIAAVTNKILSAKTTDISLLIKGPRGCGKKSYAQYLGSKLGLPVLVMGVLDFLGPVQDIIKKIRTSFSAATQQPQILVFEKIDHMLTEKKGDERTNRVIIAELVACIKTFPFPFIYLQSDETEISKDILGQFMISLQFNYLNRKESGQAFELFFKHPAPADLFSVGALTPQDYKQVAESVFAFGEENNDKEIVNSLRLISQEKTDAIIENIQLGTYDISLVNCDTDIDQLTNKLKNLGVDSTFSMLLYGVPGTGKSEYLRYLAEQIGIEVMIKRGSDIVSKWIGETERNIAQAFKDAALRKAFLIFDEADSLLGSREASQFSWQDSKVNEMLTWMESHAYPFACTTNLLDKIDPAAIRRFIFKIQFNYLSKEQVGKAFKVFFDQEPPEQLSEIGGLTPGDFSTVKKKATIFGELSDKDKLVELLAEEAKKKSRSAISYVAKDSVSFNPKLINPDTDLDEIEKRLLLPEAKKNFSFLFYGPPGTGKSNYLRYLASQMGIEFIQKRTSDILDKWLGNSEKAIAAAFNEAADRKAFLIFDEADSLLSSRKNARFSWQISQVNEMLTWMESHPYPFACTTNLMSQMDEASIRRFTFKVKFDFLNADQIREGFRAFFNIDPPDDLLAFKMFTPALFASTKKKAEIFGTQNNPESIIKLMKDEIKILGYREPEKINDTFLRIPFIANSVTPLSEGTAKLQSAVVTVKVDGGHGSGFFISHDGYLLTNQHVAQDNKFVTIKLTTGRQLPGEVLRTNADRDVALIKVNEANMPALPLVSAMPDVGADVYAVGTPVDERYSTTISKGIVSAYRTENGMEFVQSDVNTQPGSSGGPIVDRFGNVISVHAQGRLMPSTGEKIGVNYSIPVADALKYLAIELEGNSGQ